MILIISHPDDIHARTVIQHIRADDVSVEILDLSKFPCAARLMLRYGPSDSRFIYTDNSGRVTDFDRVRAAWWRRPQPFSFEAGLMAVDFAYSECDEAISGLWQALDIQWMNPPILDAAASRKSWQLRLACELGLRPPETLITNCPGSARDFIGRIGDVVYKPFAGNPRYWRETRVFAEAELRQIDQLRHAPVIIQERIDGEDIRVTVVGSRIFSAVIDSSIGNYRIDFRMNHAVKILETELPAFVEAAIQKLMSKMGLIYGALDFRRTPDGELRFLEINPAGQWLFVEEQTAQPISRTVAMQLCCMATC